MSGLFRYTDMAFQKIRDMGGGAGGKAKIEVGNCSTLDKRSMSMTPIKYKCVDKTYNQSKEGSAQFAHAVEAACIMRNTPEMKEYGPDVYHIDYLNMSMKMAYIESTTLKEVLGAFDYLDGSSTSNAFCGELFRLLEELVQTLSDNKIFHGDLNTGNIMFQYPTRENKKLKIIDLDNMRKYNTDDPDIYKWALKQREDLGKLMTPLITDIKRERTSTEVIETLIVFAKASNASMIHGWLEEELVIARRYIR